jgi:hypothetical protein
VILDIERYSDQAQQAFPDIFLEVCDEWFVLDKSGMQAGGQAVLMYTISFGVLLNVK